MSNYLNLDILGINDFHGCRIQLLWRNTTNDVRISIYFPQEPKQKNDHGAIYFREHFSNCIDEVITAIAEHFHTTVEQVNEWSSLQRDGTKRFSVEIQCTHEEANKVRKKKWQNVSSICNAIEQLETIATRY